MSVFWKVCYFYRLKKEFPSQQRLSDTGPFDGALHTVKFIYKLPLPGLHTEEVS